MHEKLANETQIADVHNRVKVLTLASEGYRKIRHRFLEVYRRDVLDDKQGRKKIGEGNEAAHEGDAIADAGHYTFGERHDEKVLVNFYGLTTSQISHLGKCRTFKVYIVASLCSIVQAGDFNSISALNAGATWKANGPITHS
jgi:hypothetical protein